MKNFQIPFTLNELIDRVGNFYPSKIFISDDESTLSYKAFINAGHHLSNILTEQNIQFQDRILVSTENSTCIPLVIYACSLLGAICVPISFVKGSRLDFIMKDCNPRLIITADTKRFSKYKTPILGLKQIMDSILNKKEGKQRAYAKVIDLDLLLLLYTSGSTGNPKAVALNHSNILSASESISRYLEINEKDRIINFNPFSFDYGLYHFIICANRGASLFLQKNFVYKEEIMQIILSKRITVLPFIPSQIISLCNKKNKYKVANSVRIITNTGAPFPSTALTQLRTIFPNAEIFAMYGLTECKRVSFLDPSKLSLKKDSVGQAMPNTRVKIIDGNFKEMNAGDTGQLVVQGRNVMVGYWNNDKATRKKIKKIALEPPYLLTGDYFYSDSDKDLFFVGRRDDIYKSYGLRISTKDIEHIISKHEKVAEVAVVGKYEENNAYFIAYIVLNSKALPAQIKEFIAMHVENQYMIPRDIHILSKIPKTTNGKIDYKKIEVR